MNRQAAIAFNSKVVERFRARRGSGPLGDDLPFNADGLLLLTHTGARTGTRRTNPLGHLELDGGRLFVVASFMGAPRHPDWYHNVLAHPEVEVELGGEHFPALASEAAAEEHPRLYAEALSWWPFLEDHQRRAGRRIPLVELRRR
ncbi:nitroreductase/quinone reductase family protein [Streptomyces alkaliterrae]|uniref:Nitroreductase family deazaflavin-dependent oxidoreductase n=1 Tax=Streptomyces alkaliterrae TaxID=2213162 RepID=A0A5P0YPA6_9ACTN|nr:nitroreductase/quinone reductase family protein [Streptomyces alkaliterrae]MBB1252025.1 nitroreductase family deazaflavin-dependent oxidoreductase [Streptomyces alkaliterrae]MBB1257470.1 nitroreductase family deazaflavin-dependent oxidoreductase [Streptomyces alkaliterrae]MQS00359.1 nitroreductase family deazaflavin-dependent oxidoreductase [Streptomyces alkaliterrae]